MGLRDHKFSIRYTKATDDVSESFYLPCMRNSISYDRISGYFRSTIFILAWDALKDFVHNGGKMRIICSPYINQADQQAVEEGYLARSSEEAHEALLAEIEDLLQNDYLKDPVRALACLIAEGIVDIQIAVGVSDDQPNLKKLFHEKAGVFTDSHGDSIAFEGSMNETFNGLSSDGNIEAVEVYIGWDDGRDGERVKRIKRDFEMLWQGGTDRVKLYKLPDEAKEILQKCSKGCDWEKVVDEIVEKDLKAKRWKANPTKKGRTPRKHQMDALEKWLGRGRMGILEHATGSGKTFTALCAIKNGLDNGYVPLILVPSKELLYQWDEEIKKEFAGVIDIKTLLCGDGNNLWKQSDILVAYSTPSSSKKKVIIATMDTAVSPQFLTNIVSGNKLFVVADEVHRLGSPNRRQFFQLSAGAKLGLSATPKRYGDVEGTQAIINYFGGLIDPPFTLQDAIKSGVLTKYFYYPVITHLSAMEQEKWDQLTNKISALVARNFAAQKSDPFDDQRLKAYLLQRSRILKNAESKIDLAVEVIKKYFSKGQKWIVYCDNKDQLEVVKDKLNEIKTIPGLIAYDYHSEMQGDRTQTLSFFQSYGGVVVSIKCLDEGVDIPATTHALILASSKNPREFIQRRGRILRRSDDTGKMYAYLYDAIVVPNKVDGDNVRQTSIIEAEMARAIQFGSWAENKSSCVTELKDIAIKYSVDIDCMLQGGYEEDNEDK